MTTASESGPGRRPAHLRVEDLAAGYGGFLVLRDLTLEAQPGLTVIVGANGAGKTTLMRAITGLIARQGRVLLDSAEIPPDATTSSIVGRGLVLVPEGRHLFARMSVVENLELGAWRVAAGERAARLCQTFAAFPQLAEPSRTTFDRASCAADPLATTRPRSST